MRTSPRDEAAYYAVQDRVWSTFAPAYDAVIRPLRGLRDKVVRLVDLPGETRLLDVATGTGAQAFAFARRLREVVGVDLSEAMLRVARQRNGWPNLSFQQADATALPFADASFDAVSISFGLHEMPGGVRERAVRELARVVRPEGTVVVVDYARPRGWLAYHLIKLYERDEYADFVRADLPALLAGAGLEVTREQPLLGGVARLLVARRRAMPGPCGS